MNYNFIDLTGRKFGKLLVLKLIGTNKWQKSLWLCRCGCGKKTIVVSNNLKNGNTKSCGCFKKEFAGEQNLRHGHSKRGKTSKTYWVWARMLDRCNNPNNPKYNNYGERGITICNSWLEPDGQGFLNFLKDMGECPFGLTLDRIDNNKLINGYSLENCRWATPKEQARNTRRNHLEIFNNESKCISALAEEYKISPQVVRGRIKIGWPLDKALTTPVRYRRKNKGTSRG